MAVKIVVKGKIVGILDSDNESNDEVVIRLYDGPLITVSKAAFVIRDPDFWHLHSAYEGVCDVDVA